MFGLLNAPSPERASGLGARAEKRTTLGEARHICRIDGSDNVPASLLRGIGLCLPCWPRARSRRKGPSELFSLRSAWPHPPPPLSSGGGGSHERRRGTLHKHWLAPVGPHGWDQWPAFEQTA